MSAEVREIVSTEAMIFLIYGSVESDSIVYRAFKILICLMQQF
jgi:hypothetical protein